MSIRAELLAVLAQNGSCVINGCNEETIRAIRDLVLEGLVYDEDDARGCRLVITRKGLMVADGGSR